MKCSNFVKLFVLGLILTIGTVGCVKKPGGLTPLPGKTGGTTQGGKPAEMIDKTPPVAPPDPGATVKPLNPVNPGDIVALPPREGLDNMNEDRSFFQANTVYFDYDSFVVKSGERSKAEAVAAHLKGHANHKLKIEGHCDERGTEEYNRSLGERRALALREYLINLGVGPDRVYTLSWGEDKPAVQGHDESAWSKNRRGEFILYTPKQ